MIQNGKLKSSFSPLWKRAHQKIHGVLKGVMAYLDIVRIRVFCQNEILAGR